MGQYKSDSTFNIHTAKPFSTIPEANKALQALVDEHNDVVKKLNAEILNLERSIKTGQSSVTQQILGSASSGGGLIGTHNILSATHPDTLPATVIRGDIIVGQAALPLWTRLALGTAGQYPRSNGTDLLYSNILDADLPATIVRTSRTLTINGTLNRVAVTGGAQDLSANRTWTVDIDAAYVGQSSITTLGTITTGVWQGSKVGLAFGGTNADLSATGGAAQYLKQSSAGATITVGTIPASDIVSGQALSRTNDTNVTLTLGGSPTTCLLVAASITVGWTGLLGLARGGTNTDLSAGGAVGDILYANAATTFARLAANSTATNKYLQSVSSGNPSWQQISASDIGSGAALTVGNDTNVTLTTGGTPATALLVAASITAGWTGTLAIARGGTGQSTALAAFNALSPLTTKGDLLTRDSTNNIRVGVGTDGQILEADSTQASGIKWANPSAATAHNILSATHTDTLTATVVRGDTIIGNSTPAWSRLAVGGASTLFQSNGTDPSWGTVNILSAFHGDTLAASVTRGDVIIGNSTPKWSRLAVGGASTLFQSNGTDPSWGTVNLLSAFHGDTLAATVVRGDLITGNATPAWSRLAIGTTGKFLRTNGTDASWQTVAATDISGAQNVSTGQSLSITSGSGTGASLVAYTINTTAIVQDAAQVYAFKYFT